MRFIRYIFGRDHERYEGVRRVNVYLLRVLYALMATMLAYDVWSYIFGHQGVWDNREGMVWSVWAGFSTLAILGVFHPLRMIPILLLEILYKGLWLILVAWPLWKAGTLTGSPAMATTAVFLPVVIVVLIMPWGYVVREFVVGRKIKR